MIFTISASSYSLTDKERKLFEELGFTFEEYGNVTELVPKVDILNLEGLVNFQKRVGNPIIIDGDNIEIYNGYRE